MVSSNRSAGKTTWFSNFVVDKFLTSGEQFVIVSRFDYEKKTACEAFLSTICPLFFENSRFLTSGREKDPFFTILIDKKPAGFSIALNSYESIKKTSNVFSRVEHVIFDEFQRECGGYLKNEVEKFISIHTSISRAPGKPYRRVPVYMLSNNVDVVNPYFLALGIDKVLRPNVRFYAGDGWVAECAKLSAIESQHNASAFSRAFSKSHSKEGSSYSGEFLQVKKRPQGCRPEMCFSLLGEYFEFLPTAVGGWVGKTNQPGNLAFSDKFENGVPLFGYSKAFQKLALLQTSGCLFFDSLRTQAILKKFL